MATNDPFFVSQPVSGIPILLSVPHCGVEFPPEVAAKIRPRYVENPEDTDWFVHDLYNFATDMGITTLHARYSRYVVDLNRDPEGQPLYKDGRQETELMPTRSFAGEPLYDGAAPDAAEQKRRVAAYYRPYHDKLRGLLAEMKKKFGVVLLYDAHSIVRFVPTIRPTPFPDLILGDQRGRTADARIIQTAVDSLQAGGRYELSHNDPFQGGYITRHYGQPFAGVHALQLEMSQDVYMEGGKLDTKKAEPLRAVLKTTLERLAEGIQGFGSRRAR